MRDNNWLKWVSAVTACGLMALALALAANHAAAQDEAQPPVLNVGGVTDGSGGTIKGIVKFDGKQARRKPIRMDADPVCEAAHGDTPVLSERWVFGDNDTLQNVFVYVSAGLEGKSFDPPNKTPVLDQRGCVYAPHVMGVVAGQTILILNSDNTMHNVHATPKLNANFNQSQAPSVKISATFEDPEMAIGVKCDIHTWMGAYIHVMEHPFFAITQQDGTFEIKGLPPGEYELRTWHEFNKFKPDQQVYKVTVEEGGAAEVTVTYSPPKKKG
ncbi:MAG: carboxypeptidase regulatory-like domain-containing protein [Phycisphaeraceae bacterium]